MDSTSSLLEFPGQIFHFAFTQDVVIPLIVEIFLLVIIEIFIIYKFGYQNKK